VFNVVTLSLAYRKRIVVLMLWCRIGDIGRLMVQRVTDAEPGTFELATSYPTHSRMDLSHDMDLFIGGFPTDYHVRHNHYSAFVHKLHCVKMV